MVSQSDGDQGVSVRRKRPWWQLQPIAIHGQFVNSPKWILQQTHGQFVNSVFKPIRYNICTDGDSDDQRYNVSVEFVQMVKDTPKRKMPPLGSAVEHWWDQSINTYALLKLRWGESQAITQRSVLQPLRPQ